MSCAGMPSVMAQISRMPASAASMIESAQNAAGTKDDGGLGAGFLDRFLDRVEDRKIRCRLPPFPGVTPPTSLVP